MPNPPPGEKSTTSCYLCSQDALFSEMHPVASPSIGPQVDVASSGTGSAPSASPSSRTAPICASASTRDTIESSERSVPS